MQTLILKHLEPVAAGTRRFVFVHPHDSGLLVKVLRPDRMKDWWPRPVPWRRRTRRFQHLFPFFQEVREHMAACVEDGRPPRHLQNIVGFADTDYGLGLVYSAVRQPDGRLAPTLSSLIRTAEPDACIAAFEEFKKWLMQSRIVISELHMSNIVCTTDVKGFHLVLIDGVGDKAIIPLRGYIPWLNRWRKRQYLTKLEQTLRRIREKAAQPT